jgi:hypothetical protein
VRIASVLVALLGMTVAIVALPASASAAGGALCETNGNFCVGAPQVFTDAPVDETPTGRLIDIEVVSSTPTDLQVELALNTDTALCVAAADNQHDVVLHHCNGGLGTVWHVFANSNGHLQFQDREFGTWLAGHNNGTQFQVKQAGLNGWFYNFDQV